MKTSITKSKIFVGTLKLILVVAFCLVLWEVLALAKDNEFILPRVGTTLNSLFEIVTHKSFFSIVLATAFRVISGLLLGVVSGICLATICHFIPFINIFVSPILSIIKATPVASFIVLLWLSLSGDSLTILIAFLMVLPIVWQNIMDAYATLPVKLVEVTEIFGVSFGKKIKYLYLPHLFSYLVPAFITSIGLAWKSEIATEIIAYTTNSIGQQINNHKQFSETSFVFAWTIIIVIFSILLESATKYLLKRCLK